MMLPSVSCPTSFMAKDRPGVGEAKCLPPPGGTTNPFAAAMARSLRIGGSKSVALEGAPQEHETERAEQQRRADMELTHRQPRREVMSEEDHREIGGQHAQGGAGDHGAEARI